MKVTIDQDLDVQKALRILRRKMEKERIRWLAVQRRYHQKRSDRRREKRWRADMQRRRDVRRRLRLQEPPPERQVRYPPLPEEDAGPPR